MTIECTSVDRDVLPDALLDGMKAHIRVEHARDDVLLRTYTAAAIGLVESRCNVSINPAAYVVTGDELQASAPRWLAGLGMRPCWVLPRNNVQTMVVLDSADAGAADISDQFELWNPELGGSASSYLVGLGTPPACPPAAAMLSLEVGLEDPADLAPAFFVLIARLVGSMYENREASVALWADTFAEELGAAWRPGA